MAKNAAKIVVIMSFAVLLILHTGCGGRKKPDGMPALYPCKLTFTQENAPLTDALVTFHSSEPGFQWTITGKTDPTGAVQFNTDGFYAGVPEGKYKITVNKTGETATHYVNVVDKKFDSVATTTLDIEIKKKGNDQTFDVGKAAETVISRKKGADDDKNSK